MINALRSDRHSAGMAGRTTPSAASAISKKSMPVLTPILSGYPISASTGALPALAPKRRQDPSIAAPAHRRHGGHPETEVLVPMKAHLGVFAETRRPGRPVGHAKSSTRAPAVDDVITRWQPASAMMRAWAASFSGAMVWAIIKKPDGFQTQFAGRPEMLDRHVGFRCSGAIRQIDPPFFDVVLGAHTGQHQASGSRDAPRPTISSCSGVREAIVER